MSAMENKKYCIFCGSENTADADTCAACGKTMHPKEELLKEYLYRKTKARLRGKAEDSFLSILKNWILSHLYGLVVTISLITLAVVRASGGSPAQPSYVRKVSPPQRPDLMYLASLEEGGSTLPEPTPAPETPEEDELAVTEEDTDTISHLMYEFDFYYITAQIAAEGGFMETDETSFERSSLEDCLVPASYGYNGTIEYGEPDHTEFSYNEVYMDPGKPVINAPSTDLGKRILADGHPVVEYLSTTTYSGMGPSFSRSFLFVSTKLDGRWYIAEVLEQ